MDIIYTASMQRRPDANLKRLADSIDQEGDLKQLKEDKNILIILLYYFHLEGFLNLIGSKIWNIKEWEIIERSSTKGKLNLIADKLNISISIKENDAFDKMHRVRNDLVHPKPNKVETKFGVIKNSNIEDISSRDLKEVFYKWHEYENDKVICNIKKYIPELCIKLAKNAKVTYTCGGSISANMQEIK